MTENLTLDVSDVTDSSSYVTGITSEITCWGEDCDWPDWVRLGLPLISVTLFVIVVFITWYFSGNPDDDDVMRGLLLADRGTKHKLYTDEAGRENIEMSKSVTGEEGAHFITRLM